MAHVLIMKICLLATLQCEPWVLLFHRSLCYNTQYLAWLKEIVSDFFPFPTLLLAWFQTALHGKKYLSIYLTHV